MTNEPKKLIYEMYPPSWKGGFPEMAKHLDRLENLNIDYVWLTPCYPSGGFDGGYDITNYIDIDPAYGTLGDFDNFVEKANSLGIEVIMDLVPNHTSDQHPWFIRSIEREYPYDEYYLWSDKNLGWGTMFDGSSAFEWEPQREQFYCHIYHDSQPDLNWSNPHVIAEFEKIIDFWTIDHGVSGFRIDSVQLISKKFTSTILPRSKMGTIAGLWKYYQKSKTPRILADLLDGRGLFNFGEMTCLYKGMFDKMVKPRGPLDAGLNLLVSNAYDKRFGIMDADENMQRLKKYMKSWAKNSHFIAALESHDVPRFTSRAGVSGKRALDILFANDPYIICLYQGEELGLKNPNLGDNISSYKDIQTIMWYETAISQGEDPNSVIAKLKQKSRDNARNPIDLNEYARQESDKNSCLHYARNLIDTWKSE